LSERKHEEIKTLLSENAKWIFYNPIG
jgi:hypothetical protein